MFSTLFFFGFFLIVVVDAVTNFKNSEFQKTSLKVINDKSQYIPYFDLYNNICAFTNRRNINGKNYLSSLRNQDIPHYCNSGWAIAVTSALSDRFRYQSKGMWPTHELSAQALINCDLNNNGCSGGDAFFAYQYIFENGIPDETCLPLTGTEERCIPINICRSCTDDGICNAVRDFTKYRISDYGQLSSEPTMKYHLFHYGTITCAINVTPSFRNYQGGIFTDSSGPTISRHTVGVVGWGEENGIHYWIIRNTWGSYWGERGFARILRGFDMLGIESECSYGDPVLEMPLNSTQHESRPLRNFVSCGYPTDWTRTHAVITSPLPWTYVNVSSLPTTWDIRDIVGNNFATPNKNQHSPQFCNSCWAQATATALADRLNLYNQGKWPLVELSSQAILNCAVGSCAGGNTGDVYRMAYMVGIPDRTCQAYEGKKKQCGAMGVCMDCNREYCWPVEKYRKVFVEEFGEVQGVSNMKAEIYTRGPITCFMVMTEEFMQYKGGVFVETDHVYKGGHIVEVAGWGYDEETERHYWIARNNWGDDWGENGWFRINMGGSNLMIESTCSWGVPVLQNVQ